MRRPSARAEYTQAADVGQRNDWPTRCGSPTAQKAETLKHSLGILLALAAHALAPTAHAADLDVGVSIGISQPGVYGRIDIGRFPQPQVVVSAPVLIRPARVNHEPVYLWVPPGHRKHWGKHCHRYQACGVPVYFVADDWYERQVMKDRGRDERPGKGRDGHPGRGHGHGKGRDRD